MSQDTLNHIRLMCLQEAVRVHSHPTLTTAPTVQQIQETALSFIKLVLCDGNTPEEHP